MKAKFLTALFIVIAVIGLAAGCAWFGESTPTPPVEETPSFNPEPFEYTEINGEITLTRYIGEDTDVAVPSEINGMPVTAIGMYCFSSSNITSLYIPATVKSLGAYMCYNVATLATIDFEDPDAIEDIGYRIVGNTPAETAALQNNNGIYTIGKFLVRVAVDYNDVLEIPHNVTDVAGGAFDNVRAKEIIFHENFTLLNVSEIYAASEIECITIGCDTAEFSAGRMFSGEGQYIKCRSGSTAEKYALDNGYFYETTDNAAAWEYRINDGYAVLTKYLGSSVNVRIVSEIDGYIVNMLGDGSCIFTDSSVKKLYIPDTVTQIADNFVNGVTDLTEIQFRSAAGIISIGSNAFKDTVFENQTNNRNNMSVVGTILTRHFGSGDIVLPEGITGIAGGAFSDNVESIFIEEGCTWLSDDFLSGCVNIKWVYIPNSITWLKNLMFEANRSIIIRCDAVSYAAKFAQANGYTCDAVYYWDYELDEATKTAILLQYTGKQKQVIVPSKIGDYIVTALVSIRNTEIERLTIPSTVTRIEDMFAYGVATLDEVKFANESNLQYIGAMSFYGTLYEAAMNQLYGMLVINNVLVSYTGSGDVVVPSTVKEIGSLAFYKSGVKTITITYGCRTINARAFSGCEYLEWVYIPDTVDVIKEHILTGSDGAEIKCHINSFAEQYARNNGYKYVTEEYSEWLYDIVDGEVVLTLYLGNEINVVIPDTLGGYPVVELGPRCFADSNIVSVHIGANVKRIGAYAFSNLPTLEKVTFANEAGIEYIGTGAFYNTAFYDNAESGNGIFHINGILLKCTAWGDVELPYYIWQIAEDAFNGSSATSVKINEGCKIIDSYAFRGMADVKWIYIPDGISSIGSSILSESDENAVIKCHITSFVVDYAAENGYEYECVEYEYEYEIKSSEDGNEFAVLTKYLGDSAEVSVPRKIGPYTVIEIADGCFADKQITFLFVPSEITILGSEICEPALSEAVFEDPFSIEYIAADAFKGTAFENDINIDGLGLSIVGGIITRGFSEGSLIISDDVRMIAGNAFKGNADLISVTVNDGCLSIGDGAFAYAAALDWVYIPDSVTSIGLGIFEGTAAYIRCNVGSYAEQYASSNNIRYVLVNGENFDWEYKINDGTITLERYTGNEKNVVIPSEIGGTKVTAIGNGCFYNSMAESIYVPNTVTSIGNEAFFGTMNLKELIFEDVTVIEYIGYGAFDGSDIINYITDENGIAAINGILVNYTGKGNVMLDSSISGIAGHAFMGNGAVTSITINSSCSYIGYQAFADMSVLEWVSIPNSVKDIDDAIFSEGMNVLIRCYQNSYAEKYASENGYAYELLENEFEYNIVDSYVVLKKYIGSSKNVVIPPEIDGLPVAQIGDECFVGTDIEFVWIPQTVVAIGNRCFYGVSSLASVVFQNERSIEKIGNQAFKETRFENVTGVDAMGTVKINGILIRHFGSGDVVLSDDIRTIAGGAFYDRQDIMSIVINDECTTIDEAAFSRMYNLESVYIPDSVTQIASGAFDGCNEMFYIICNEGSYAQRYARTYNIPYRLTNR